MKMVTKHFGELEVDDGDIIFFDEGIPGFEDLRRFVLLSEENSYPFSWLQSVDDGDIAFVLIDPWYFKPDYSFDIDEGIISKLEIQNEGDVKVFAITVIPEDVKLMSANLRAPIVVNINRKKGIQYIMNDDRYSIRHYILEEMKKQGE